MMNKPPVPDVPMPKKSKGIGGVELKGKGKRVNQTELGAYLGIAKNTIQKWAKVGLPFKKIGTQVTYDIGEVMKWRIDWETETLKDELVFASREGGDSMTPMQAKLRREVAQALTAELDLAIKREQVANIDDLMETFSEALIEVRAKLVSMSSRLSGILSHKDDEGVSKLLDGEVSDMLEVLSDYD
jgi:phage terminase Nu1 subunit (DNA packaging protein)